MQWIVWLRRCKQLASVLLIIAFFAPLSQCSHINDSGIQEITYQFAYHDALDAISQLSENIVDNLFHLFTLFVIFIAPLLLIRSFTKITYFLLLMISAWAITFLKINVFELASAPCWGGWLAILAWVLLSVISVVEIIYAFIKKRLERIL